jgi:hypothetical protein
MAPVALAIERPAGSDGVVNESTVPVTDAVLAVIAVPFEYVAGFTVYARFEGGLSAAVMAILKVTVVKPAALRAVTTYPVAACAVVGVPVMAPVALAIERPAGSDGVVNESTVPVSDDVLDGIAVPVI